MEVIAMEKTQWAKSSNGPDWTDVEIALRAVDGLHGGITCVTLSCDGIGSTGGLIIHMISTFPAVPGSDGSPDVVSISRWPCKDCATLEGHVLGGIYRHDFNISEAYMQESLWRRPPDTGKKN
jgi:hypothetical protein